MEPKITVMLIMARERRLSMLETLEVSGIYVLPVCDCSEARRTLETQVVLTDRALPDGDWRAVLEIVAQERANVQVVVCSRLRDHQLVFDVVEQGAYDVLLLVTSNRHHTGAAMLRNMLFELEVRLLCRNARLLCGLMQPSVFGLGESDCFLYQFFHSCRKGQSCTAIFVQQPYPLIANGNRHTNKSIMPLFPPVRACFGDAVKGWLIAPMPHVSSVSITPPTRSHVRLPPVDEPKNDDRSQKHQGDDQQNERRVI